MFFQEQWVCLGLLSRGCSSLIGVGLDNGVVRLHHGLASGRYKRIPTFLSIRRLF